jgi:hypothetical protein
MYLLPNPKLCLNYEVRHEEKWFWVSNMKISKTSQKIQYMILVEHSEYLTNIQLGRKLKGKHGSFLVTLK